GKKTTATELGVSEQAVERAEKIAKITPAAKDAAKEAGIDNNQSKLLKVAAVEPEKQVEAVEQVAAKPTKKSARKKRRPDDGDDVAAKAARFAAADEAVTAEIEHLQVRVDGFASKRTELDLDIARTLHGLLYHGLQMGTKLKARGFIYMLAKALERELAEARAGGNGAAETEAPDRWIESDTL